MFDKKLRQFYCWLLLDLFKKSGLTANQITISNFLIHGLLAVFCFAIGYNWLALMFCILYDALDYIDGEIARFRGGNTKVGEFIDTSLDWLLYLLIIGGIGYATNTVLAFICVLAVTYDNYLQYRSNFRYKFNWCLYSPIPIILGGICFNKMALTLSLISAFAVGRSITLWRYSLKELSRE